MEIVLLLILAGFIFTLARKILQKAGFDPIWAFVLIIPVLNVIMVWVFALSDWPNLPKKNRQ